MTMRRKGRRSLVVEGARYYWAMSEHDDSLSGAIVLADGPRQKLCVRVPADYEVSSRISHNAWSLELRRVIIAPGFVRRAITYGLAHGWTPTRSGKDVIIEYRRGQFHIWPRKLWPIITDDGTRQGRG
jgi:hypothetical protein